MTLAECETATRMYLDAIAKKQDVPGSFKLAIGKAPGDKGLSTFVDEETGDLVLQIASTKREDPELGRFEYKFNGETKRVLVRRALVEWEDLTGGPDEPGERAAAVGGEGPAGGGNPATAPATAPAIAPVHAAPPVADKVCSGSSAKGADVKKSGTAGLNVKVNGEVVCLGSAHVFRKHDTTATHPRVRLANQNIAFLRCYQPYVTAEVNPTAIHFWDLAMAKYDNEADAALVMCRCGNNTAFAYPSGFTPSGVGTSPNVTYHKVGVSGCSSGAAYVRGDYSGLVPLPGGEVWMNQQLVFLRLTDDGDSGAVIIRSSDNTVTGLHMLNTTERVAGRRTKVSVANPLYRAPWTVEAVTGGLLKITTTGHTDTLCFTGDLKSP